MSSLSERLIHLQFEKQKLKKDIAKAAGVSVMAYYRYENGERQPTADTLTKLADYFDVSADYLLGRSDNPVRCQYLCCCTIAHHYDCVNSYCQKNFGGDIMPNFAERILELRKSGNETQKSIAGAIGCTEQHYQRLEYGKVMPNSKLLEKLADYYEVTTDYILGRTNEPSGADELLPQIDYFRSKIGVS